MHISLSPVYSKVATAIPVQLQPLLPPGWRLSQHQVATYLALADPNGPEVVINTAMTGDGKSLGGQLLALQQGFQVPFFAMYPTNELIADQTRQAAQTWQMWQQRTRMGELNSRELDAMMATDDFRRRGEALLSRLRNCEAIFTNPDIFHYIMHIFYVRGGKHGDAPDQIIGRLLVLFNQFTFDEFHIFETPQVISVMSALLLLRAMAGVQRKRFLFQSATPSPLLRRFLDQGEFSYQEISGDYLTDLAQADPAQWRQILQSSALHFAEGTVEQWLDENLETVLLPFFLQHHPAAKGAIIVNSIAQAKRVKARLQAAFAPHHLSVGENTGLSSPTARAESYHADILVGTSTVDVGVDFHINFLLFESRDAGSFLQRLGRLGRHSGYTRNGQSIAFAGNFVAYACLPRWTLEGLFQAQAGSPAPLVPEMQLERTRLAAIIENAFPPPATFDRYAKQWGGLQSIKILKALSNPTISNQYSNLRDDLAKSYQTVLGVSINQLHARYKALTTTAKVLVEEAISFRGGSYFDCAVLDMTESNPHEQAKQYDLLWLVANGELAPLSKEEFWMEARKNVTNAEVDDDPVAYFRLLGFRPERVNFTIALQHDLMEWDSSQFGTAIELSGITLDAAYTGEIPHLNTLNRNLSRRVVPAFICQRYHPLDLKRMLRLPLLFALYSFHSRDGCTGAIAFGREALLLDAAVVGRRLDCGGSSLFL